MLLTSVCGNMDESQTVAAILDDGGEGVETFHDVHQTYIVAVHLNYQNQYQNSILY